MLLNMQQELQKTKMLSYCIHVVTVANGLLYNNWSVTQILSHQGTNATTTPSVLKTTTKEKDQFRKKQFESMAADLIASSDRLVNQLASQRKGNSKVVVAAASILLKVVYWVMKQKREYHV